MLFGVKEAWLRQIVQIFQVCYSSSECTVCSSCKPAVRNTDFDDTLMHFNRSKPSRSNNEPEDSHALWPLSEAVIESQHPEHVIGRSDMATHLSGTCLPACAN